MWYLTSAFLFCEVYIFATSEKANLGWVDTSRSYEQRSKLNERAVLFRCEFFILAVAQAVLHMYHDTDRLLVPVVAQPAPQPPQDETTPTVLQRMPVSIQKLQKTSGQTAIRAVTLTYCVILLGPIAYYGLLRQSAWAIAYPIAKTFFTLHKSARPTGLTDVMALAFRLLFASLLQIVLWEISNQAFTLFASEEPLRKGQPLTSDSKNPNGSLITGLQAKKEIPRNMAYWELALITERFEDRRKTLYQDLDRVQGSTWSQVSALCIEEIQRVNKSIQAALQPSAPSTAEQPNQQPPPKQRISQPLKEGNVFNAAPQPKGTFDALASGVGSVAKSLGSSPGANPVGQQAQKMIGYSTDKVLSKEQQQNLNTANLSRQANKYILLLFESPLGVVFRQPFARRINAIVFGTPYSRASNLHHAIQALCKLVVCSLKEDTLGQVQDDVSSIIRTLVSTIQNLQTLLQALPIHWSDVAFDGNRQVKEVDDLLAELRDGLEQVIICFGEYADAIGLSRAELRAAKEAVNKKPEMEVARK